MFKPGKQIKEICASLGPDYCIGIVDWENVIYRNYHNGFDIEISNLDNRRKHPKANIYIWSSGEAPGHGRYRVRSVFDVPVEKLSAVLNEISEVLLTSEVPEYDDDFEFPIQALGGGTEFSVLRLS